MCGLILPLDTNSVYTKKDVNNTTPPANTNIISIMMLIDVKALARRADGTKINRMLRPSQKKLEQVMNTKVQLIYADVDSGEIDFNRRK